MWRRLSAKNRRNMIILFSTLVVIMLGFGIIIPIMPFYVESMGASGIHLGLLMAIFATMQFLFSPLWGELSDRIGRRPVLIIGIVGNVATQLLFGLSTTLEMLFVARALAGILSSATLPTAMAYIGDSTSEEDRGAGMGIMGAAMGIGMVLGPGLGGWLAGTSLALPFFFAAGLSFVLLIFVYFLLPETLSSEERSRQQFRMHGPDFGLLWQALQSPIGYLLLTAFLLSFGLTNFEGIFGLYAAYRYDYQPEQVGGMMTVVGLTTAIVQGFLTGPLARKWGESRLIQGSLLMSALGFLLMLAANSFAAVLFTTAVFVLGTAMLRPAVSSLISKESPYGQGVSMGLNNAFMSLGRVVGPIWAGAVLDIHVFLPYLSGAIIMAVGFLATFRQRPAPISEDHQEAGPAPKAEITRLRRPTIGGE